MDTSELRKAAARLESRVPLVGGAVRRAAARKLAEDSGPAAVPILAGALSSFDPQVVELAGAALRSLKSQPAIDALCGLWAKARDARLGDLVAQCGYVASQPLDVRVLSALKADRAGDVSGEASAVEVLLRALDDSDSDVAARVGAALRSLKSQPAIDALCEIATLHPDGPAAEIVRERDYQHSSVSRRCLQFLLTGQIERYLDLDFDLEYARAEYAAGDEDLRRRIGDLVRSSGDTRLVSIIRQTAISGGIDKKAGDLTEREGEVALDVYTRRERWEDVFWLLWSLPLKTAVNALDALAKAAWRPADERLAGLLEELLALRKAIGKLPEAPPAPDVALGPVVRAWIERGRSGGEFAGLEPAELRRRVREADPPEAVAALAAIAARGEASADDIEAARTHAHWPLRLACLALYEVAPEFALSDAPVAGEGGGLWVQQLAPSLLHSSLFGHKAVGLSLEQVEALDAALGAAKDSPRKACGRLLAALGAHMFDAEIGTPGEMVVRISDTEIGRPE